MDDTFRINVLQLKEGKTKAISEECTPEELGLNESETLFKRPVSIEGEGYLADGELVLHLRLKALACLPCSVCNELTDVRIDVDNVYICTPLDEIKGGVFDMRGPICDELMLALPQFTECGGRCPLRGEMQGYMKKADEEEVYRPFKDL